jgi:hypothetical protein
VAYVDARHVQERLNKVCGGRWDNKYREVIVKHEIVAVEATIEIEAPDRKQNNEWYDYSHSDVGSFDNVNQQSHGLKAVYSDAFKRAAVHFGIAVSLYSHPTSFLMLDKKDMFVPYWKDDKRKDRKVPTGISEKGEAKLRESYKKWLKEEGIDEFGKPL